MIVEPGAFRTAFYDERLGAAERPMAAYDELAERYRKGVVASGHDQPGDPMAGGEVIVRAVLGEYGGEGGLPARLLLGSDATHIVSEALEARLSELRAWAQVSAQSDYPRG